MGTSRLRGRWKWWHEQRSISSMKLYQNGSQAPAPLFFLYSRGDQTVWCVHTSFRSEFYSLCLVYVCVRVSVNLTVCAFVCVRKGLNRKCRYVGAPWVPAQAGKSFVNTRRDTLVRCGVCFCRLKIFWMYIDKWKLLLRDATELVYIGGLCNRWPLVFWYSVFGNLGGGVNRCFSFKICTLYFDCFLYQRHMQRNGNQPVKVRFCTAYLTPYWM